MKIVHPKPSLKSAQPDPDQKNGRRNKKTQPFPNPIMALQKKKGNKKKNGGWPGKNAYYSHKACKKSQSFFLE
jgi:hypothetical protein